jgi:hypothetical protein
MNNDLFKNIIKNAYNFEDEEKLCVICGEPIGDFDDNGIYEGEYCEECFEEAEESRLK